MTRALILLADGFEEIEAITIIDLLRRGGIDVMAAGLSERLVSGNHGIVVQADCLLDDVIDESFDLIVLPGGQPGADNLRNDVRVIRILQKQYTDNRLVAAICAAPIVLAAAGLLVNRKATSYPGYLDRHPAEGMQYSHEAVVKDGNIITSRGPGTAMDFALALLEELAGNDQRKKVEAGLQRQPS